MSAFDCMVIQVASDGATYQYGILPFAGADTMMGLDSTGATKMWNKSLFATAAQGTKADTAVQPGSLAAVATSGSYNDLSSRPSLAAVATSGAYTDLSGRPSALSLTTTGTSGSATYNSSTGVLNIPAYTVGGVSSVGVSGTDFSISGSPITTSGTIALALAVSGVSAGTYSSVTVTTKGIVTAGSNQTFNNGQSRTVVTNQTANGTQLSATRNARVRGIVSIQNTTTIGGPSSGTIVFEICATNSSTGSDWTIVDRLASTSTATLAVVLNLVQNIESSIGGEVPAGWYSRYRALTATGTVSYSATATCQEVLL